MMGLIFYIALALTVFLLVAMLLAPVILRPSPAARRMLEMVQSTRPDKRSVGYKERVQGTILSLAAGLQGRLGLTEGDEGQTAAVKRGDQKQPRHERIRCQPLYWSSR